MSIRRVLLPMLAAVLCTGCIQIRETIRLRKDGSGTVQMTVTFPQLGLRWLPGKPIANWVRPNLPDGVRLTSTNERANSGIDSSIGESRR